MCVSVRFRTPERSKTNTFQPENTTRISFLALLHFGAVIGFVIHKPLNGLSRSDEGVEQQTTTMLKNYIKIAWRNLVKHKVYSAIKVGGFAFSIAACVLISLYILHELSYDKTYPDADRIYRIVGEFNDQGKVMRGTAFQAPLSKAIATDFPEVECIGRLLPNALFYGAGSNQITTEDNAESVYEQGFTYMDQELLDMLQLPMVYGERATALTEPKTLVLTKSKAKKYFGQSNPIGRIIYLNGDKTSPYTIKGVVDDLPSFSSILNSLSAKLGINPQISIVF